MRTNQKGGGGPASTRIPAFIVLNTATISKQSININSPNKTFLAEWKSVIELEIINKKPIPKLHEATTSAKPLTYRKVSAATDGDRLHLGNQHTY